MQALILSFLSILKASTLPVFDGSADPTSMILSFLAYPEQRGVRYVNRAFDHHFCLLHSLQMQCVKELSHLAYQVIVCGAADSDTFSRVRRLHGLLTFNDVYLRKRTNIIAKALRDNHDVLNSTWRKHVAELFSELGLNKASDIGSAPSVYKTLIRASHRIFDDAFNANSERSENINFNCFVFKTSWDFLANIDRNSSSRLPPLEALSYLDSNRVMYDEQLHFLNKLRERHGLIL